MVYEYEEGDCIFIDNLAVAHRATPEAHLPASEVGLRILKAGGNAADACVAAVAALNVTEPSMCGIGGDAFCLFYDAKTRTVRGLNGSGASPAALDLATARTIGGPGGKAVTGDAMLDGVAGLFAKPVDGAIEGSAKG